jgi:hypothetical protein
MPPYDWKCNAGHCEGKRALPLDLRRVYRCKGCSRLFHAGCSGGADDVRCDDCWAKEHGHA